MAFSAAETLGVKILLAPLAKHGAAGGNIHVPGA